MLSTLLVFEGLVVLHIIMGSIGLVTFWVPVIGGKGTRRHRRIGSLFINTMLVTGATAVGMATTTLIDPQGTHPHLADHPVFADPANIEGIFGWMMLYLAILTVNLAWHGKLVIRSDREPDATRAWHNMLLQVALLAASANCLVQGVLINQVMMIGISMVGFATVGTNLYYLYRVVPSRTERVREHIKSLVGAGISVYTAFFAFGAVRLMPELALTPGLWSVPLIVGLSLIFYHRHMVKQASLTAKPA